jgi:hypothetical protein
VFVAVTTTRTVCPTSLDASSWLELVAPLTFEHASPEVLQSSH